MNGVPKRCIHCHFPFLSMSVGDDLCSTKCEESHRNFIAKFNSLKKDAKWLSHTEEIPSASNESLIRSLVTADGRGSDFKRKALGELIIRVKMEGIPSMPVEKPVLVTPFAEPLPHVDQPYVRKMPISD